MIFLFVVVVCCAASKAELFSTEELENKRVECGNLVVDGSYLLGSEKFVHLSLCWEDSQYMTQVCNIITSIFVFN